MNISNCDSNADDHIRFCPGCGHSVNVDSDCECEQPELEKTIDNCIRLSKEISESWANFKNNLIFQFTPK